MKLTAEMINTLKLISIMVIFSAIVLIAYSAEKRLIDHYRTEKVKQA